MENQVVEKKTFWETVKEKAHAAKEKAVELGKATVEWCKENPEAALAITGLVAAAGRAVIREGVKARDEKRENDHRERYIYDRSLGMYWELKRPMTTAERCEFQRLKDEGYRTGDILRSMKLLTGR